MHIYLLRVINIDFAGGVGGAEFLDGYATSLQ